jgi:membrane associated rhomboid family serine protease/Flp pilus assembly protein TadD
MMSSRRTGRFSVARDAVATLAHRTAIQIEVRFTILTFPIDTARSSKHAPRASSYNRGVHEIHPERPDRPEHPEHSDPPEHPHHAERASEAPRTSFYHVLLGATPRLWVTPTLIGANVLVFLISLALGASPIEPESRYLLELGANFGPWTLDGQWWRLLSSAFVHIGFLHLALNMWGLWLLGNIAERMFGNVTFLLLYVLSGIGGSLLSLLWHPEIISAGASGAIFGVAGGLVAFLYFGNILVPKAVIRELLGSLIFIVGFNLFLGALWAGIDNAGHIGGLSVGLVMGAALHRPLPFGKRARHRFLVVPAVLLLFVAAGRRALVGIDDNPALHAARAQQLAEDGHKDQATAELERAVALSPDSAEMKNALGTVYLDAKRYEDAVAQFRGAVDLDPQLYEPQRNLGVALWLAGHDREAGEAFELARQMKPSDVSMYIVSSSLLIEANRLDQAVSVLEEARKWAPDSPEVESAMGLARMRRGETALAVECLRKATSLAPDEAEPHNRLALALAVAGEKDESLREIETALKLAPDAHYLLDSLGTVHFYRGEAADAVHAYEKAVALAPEQAIYHYNLSLALRRDSKPREADAARKEAFRLDPGLTPPADDQPII